MTRPEPEHADIARRVCTDRQFLAWAMREVGISEVSVALLMKVSRRTVRDHVAEAKVKIDRELASMGEAA